MSGPVDVLEAMDYAIEALDIVNGSDLIPQIVRDHREARAAVAELIEAAAEMNRLAKGPVGGVSKSEKLAIVTRMDAALARVQGGAA